MSAKQVGMDEFGNRYFEKKAAANARRPKRFVIYKGAVEASKVPADWQSEHLPNLTGTEFAHRPKGHMLKGGKRAPSTGDYEAWTP